MQISLAEVRALEVELVALDLANPKVPVGEALNDEYKLAFDPIFLEEKRREFGIIFNCGVRSPELKLLRVVYLARFETTEDMDAAFMDSHFTGMNAPAISYPYLRAYVSQVLLLSGYKPVMLPTLNFQALFQDKKAKKEKQLAEQAETAP